jgi:hypothetical protein
VGVVRTAEWYACDMRRAALAALVVAVVAPSPAQAHRVRVRAPAQFQVTLAQIRYAVPHGPRPALRLALAGPNGLDYVAAALPRHQPRHALVALVAIVNRRPQGSLAADVSEIPLTTRPSRKLSAPRISTAMDVLAAHSATTSAACALGPLTVGDLRFALRAGTPPTSYGARSTIVQALAAACGRPVAPAFRLAVQPPATEPPLPPQCPPCRPLPLRIVCPQETPPPAICPA